MRCRRPCLHAENMNMELHHQYELLHMEGTLYNPIPLIRSSSRSRTHQGNEREWKRSRGDINEKPVNGWDG